MLKFFCRKTEKQLIKRRWGSVLKKEERMVKELYTAEVICNKCGRSFNPETEDYLHIEKKWGYFSKSDGRYQEIDLCQDCWNEFCSSLIIKP